MPPCTFPSTMLLLRWAVSSRCDFASSTSRFPVDFPPRPCDVRPRGCDGFWVEETRIVLRLLAQFGQSDRAIGAADSEAPVAISMSAPRFQHSLEFLRARPPWPAATPPNLRERGARSDAADAVARSCALPFVFFSKEIHPSATIAYSWFQSLPLAMCPNTVTEPVRPDACAHRPRWAARRPSRYDAAPPRAASSFSVFPG